MEVTDNLKPCGDIQMIIQHENGEQRIIEFHNAILNTGRQALAACLANNVGNTFPFYINRMLFGDGGTVDGTTKYVNSNRNGLFGITQASKPVISSIDPTVPTQVTFTSVLSYSDANGAVLSEMALQLSTGDFYSMATFPNLTKTAQMQIILNWRLSFV